MLVYTIKELCRTCYTCVRECPAKAIRIVGGQAEVYVIGKMHKGQITVDSNTYAAKGKTGTSFKIVLPRRIEGGRARAREGG